MSKSTEQLLPGLIPPKEESDEKVHFCEILDDVHPESLSEDVLAVFAKRDLFVTEADREERKNDLSDWRNQAPVKPVEERLRIAKSICVSDRRSLAEKSTRYMAGSRNGYKYAREALIRAIGSKINCYIVQREYDSTSPEEREAQERAYAEWDRYATERWKEEEKRSHIYYDDEMIPGTRCEKVVQVRKGIRRKDGRFFTQREFAVLIGYPANKYAAAEKDDNAVEDELLDKLITICKANPYYLYDDLCESALGAYDGPAVEYESAPEILTSYDTILKWIREGKPRVTYWTDAYRDEERVDRRKEKPAQKSGIDEFCKSEWAMFWDGETEWNYEDERAVCKASAVFTVRIKDRYRFELHIRELNHQIIPANRYLVRETGNGFISIPETPGETAKSIRDFLEGQFAVELDLILEDYVSLWEDEPPEMEHYEEEPKESLRGLCEMYGLKLVRFTCTGKTEKCE